MLGILLALILTSGNAAYASQDLPPPIQPPVALRFTQEFVTEQEGELHPRGRVSLEYDLSRLPQCQGSTYNGQPAWTTEAFVRFLPGNEVKTGGLNYTFGTTTHPVAFDVDIPAGAKQLEIWFRSKGRNCEPVFVSNFGRNYLFPVGR